MRFFAIAALSISLRSLFYEKLSVSFPQRDTAVETVWDFAEEPAKGSQPHGQICRSQLFSVPPMTDLRMILRNTLCHYLLLVTLPIDREPWKDFPLTVGLLETY